MSEGVLPPVPDLIPIAALQGRSMGEQRPRRRAPADLIDTAARSRVSSAAAAPPPPRARSRPARPGQRGRKSDRRRDQRRAHSARSVSKQGNRRSLSPALDKPPRVNPIFVWVRQEDTRIVDVKCEDYDKRNRILLTKTAHGWKAIPRTETMVPEKSASDEDNTAEIHHHHHHHHHHHRKRPHKHKSRRKSVSLQFPENVGSSDNECEPPWIHPVNVNVESFLPSHTIQIRRTPSPSEQSSGNVNSDVKDLGHASTECSASDKVCDVSPLENLLAVAELEFKQQMESGNWKTESENTAGIDNNFLKSTNSNKSKDGESSQDTINSNRVNNLEQTKLIDDMKIEECDDYNEDDDGIAMTDILSRLEKSLQSPENDELDTSESVENTTISKAQEVIEMDKDEFVEDSNISQGQEVISNNLVLESVPDKINSEIISEIDTSKSPSEPLEAQLEFEESCKNTELPEEPTLSDATEKPLDDKIQEKSEISSIDLNTKANNFDDEKIDNPEKSAADIPNDEKTLSLSENSELNDPDNDGIQPTSTNSETNILEILSKEVEKIEPFNKLSEKIEEKIDDQPLDFSIKSKTTALTIDTGMDDVMDEPTDLTVKKFDDELSKRDKRPRSQSSEAIQSPQPSGIPAVPHSPDLVSTSTTNPSKNTSVLLETLLVNATNKIALNSEVTITKQSEPMELENRRKSASPTVTCSEEIVNHSSTEEPSAKKFKPNDITIKHLLDKKKNVENANCSPQEPRSTSTPKLLELLKEQTEKNDPLMEFKKLILEVDIPEPLLVPKDRFVNLLKHPREEILSLMRGNSCKNLQIEDTLVIYKDKLYSVLEANSKMEKTISETKPNKPVEKKEYQSEKVVSAPNKRKHSETSSHPRQNISPEATTKNISASDIDAATEAAFSQMMMFPYQNQLEAMSWANNQQDLLQALYGSNSFLPNQMSDIHPNLQMMLGNRMPPLSPIGFPPFPSMGFTNSLEYSMWQEAMMQANLLRNKIPFENPMISPPVRDFKSQLLPPRRHSSGSQLHSSSARSQSGSSRNSQSLQDQQNLLQKLYEQNTLNSQQSYHNPFLGAPGLQQRNSPTLSVPPYNPFQQKVQSNRSIYQQARDDSYREHEKRLQQQMLLERQRTHQKHQQERLQREQRLQERLQKTSVKNVSSSNSKPFSINSYSLHKSIQPRQEGNITELSSRTGGYQPIDLSGSQNVTAKRKCGGVGSEHRSDKFHVSTTVSKSHDDTAEVGSTTASIEEMQDANTHLWHPLFGSDKGYSTSAWNMSSMAATE